MTHTGLIPHLVVDGANKAIDFYVAALGATELCRMPTPDGRLMHGAVSVAGSTLFVCDHFPDHCPDGASPPTAAKLSPVTLHVCVPDTDASIARAVAAGAAVTMPAMDAFWGDRYGRIRDPFGHEWSFSTPLAKAETKAA